MENTRETIPFDALVGDKSVREAFAVRQLESIADSLQTIARILENCVFCGRIQTDSKPWNE